MNKKGEINWILVTFIVLIASVVIIFLFWDKLDLATLTDEQVCYNSVVQRSSIIEISDLLEKASPLNCKTGYVCISKDGTCEKMISPKIIKIENSDDVYKAISEKMVSCWSTFGAGKLDYVGGDLTNNLYCSNCYQIGFDDSVDMFANDKIEKRELYRYLSSKDVSGTDSTYLEYLIGLQSAEIIENSLDSAGSEFGTISVGKQYFIVTGAFSDISKWKTTILGGAAAVGTFTILTLVTGGVAIPGLLLIVAATGVAGGGAGYFVGVVAQGDSGQTFLAPTLVEATSEDYTKLKCASIETLP